RDHPRVRGEHDDVYGQWLADEGPSPRARGARHLRPVGWGHRGTIPACAGSTPAHPLPPTWWEDHPRVRGEHDRCPRTTGGTMGPSPRARGALVCGPMGDLGAGTIPACAGST